MIIPRPTAQRGGFTLLEVLLALTIFLFALIALGHLLNVASNQVQEARYTNRAAQLCQSQMNRVIAGDVPLTGQGDVSFDEDPDWSWSIECQQESTITNLWRVQIKVTRNRSGGAPFEAALSQMVLDPAAKGTLESSSSSSGSSGTTPTQGN